MEADEARLDKAETEREANGGSPIIRWRPSVRVRLATDLPNELLDGRDPFADVDEKDSDGEEETGYGAPRPKPPENRRRSVAAPRRYSNVGAGYLKLPEIRQRGVAPEGAAAAEGAATDRRWNGPRSSRNPNRLQSGRRHYGKWYLPIRHWHVEEDAGRTGWEETVPGQSDASPRGPRGVEQRRAAEIVEYQAKLESQLQTLYSGKVYKQYIKRTGDRVPHYLLRVESPPKKEPRRAHRLSVLGAPDVPFVAGARDGRRSVTMR